MTFGAFAGGLADGIETGQKLALQRAADARDQQEFDQKKKEWARQDAMHASIAAAGNTLAPDADPSTILSPDDYTAKYTTPAPAKSFLDRLFGSSSTPAPAAAPAATPPAPVATPPATPTAVASIDPNAASAPTPTSTPPTPVAPVLSPAPDTPVAPPASKGGAFAAADAATKPKAPGKDDYVPVTKPDGSLGYALRSSVKPVDTTSPSYFRSISKAVAPFDSTVALNLAKGAQALESDGYTLMAQKAQQTMLSAAQKAVTDPQGALNDIMASHQGVPDGQQIKLTFDPKTGKIQSQYFADSDAKEAQPLGKPTTITWDNLWDQMRSVSSPEGMKDHLTYALQAQANHATQVNEQATRAIEQQRVNILKDTEARAKTRDGLTNDYIKAKTADLQDKVGEGWKAVVRTDPNNPDAMPMNGRTNKQGVTQWEDPDWGKFVDPRYMGKYKQITDFAQSKGLQAKAGADGNVYYINPKTSVASTDWNAALGNKGGASTFNPANGAAQVPAPQ